MAGLAQPPGGREPPTGPPPAPGGLVGPIRIKNTRCFSQNFLMLIMMKSGVTVCFFRRSWEK
jgi:hypothetical protein